MIKKQSKKNPVNKMKVKRSKGLKDLKYDAAIVKGGRGARGGSQQEPHLGGGGGWTRG
jgi:hypothetical protein